MISVSLYEHNNFIIFILTIEVFPIILILHFVKIVVLEKKIHLNCYFRYFKSKNDLSKFNSIQFNWKLNSNFHKSDMQWIVKMPFGHYLEIDKDLFFVIIICFIFLFFPQPCKNMVKIPTSFLVLPKAVIKPTSEKDCSHTIQYLLYPFSPHLRSLVLYAYPRTTMQHSNTVQNIINRHNYWFDVALIFTIRHWNHINRDLVYQLKI